MTNDAVERIRSATFPSALKGYDRAAVDAFLDQLAELLDAGIEADDATPSDAVRRELERIGESTKAILTDAHDAATTIRRDAEQRVRQQLAEVNLRAEALHADADEYAERVREEADAYARRTRSGADQVAGEARERAEREAAKVLEDAERRRQEIEQVITDLEARRETVVTQLRRLVEEAGVGPTERRPDPDPPRPPQGGNPPRPQPVAGQPRIHP